MQRGFVITLPISLKIARERSAVFAIDENSAGLLSGRLAGDGSAPTGCAKAASTAKARVTTLAARVTDLGAPVMRR
jgi:hypothetical protein